uniref:Uncharacterized protein n=1 Tax=Aegilops tauschii subsp. strangulata TaxID=200361 RepID=A0A453HDA6_AEGTS
SFLKKLSHELTCSSVHPTPAPLPMISPPPPPPTPAGSGEHRPRATLPQAPPLPPLRPDPTWPQFLHGHPLLHRALAPLH